jgi:hypothetical protein
MSAELCRVSLWLEALEPGKPLSFLDHHIQVGNSLLGTTPALLAKGIPDEAFTPIEGDVKAKCTELKRDNKRERTEFKSGQRYLFDSPFKLGNLAAELAKIDDTPDDSAESVLEKERRYAELVKGQAYRSGRLLADIWCAAFLWKKDDSDLGNLCPTERTFRKVESSAAAGLLPHVRAEVERLRDQFQFFHWHLAFPDVFRLPGEDETPENDRTGWTGGFDVVLGNPPWERVKLQEKEWFAERSPEIANAPNAAARKRLIESLRTADPALHSRFLDAVRQAEGESHLLRNSERFPLCGRGDINVYAVFAEGMRSIVSPIGRSGCVLPSGIATDDTTKFFFQDLVQKKSLASLYSFENEEFVFPGVHHATKFCLLTVGSGFEPLSDTAEFVFFARQVDDLLNVERRFTLSSRDIALLNPNTHNCPTFRSHKDAEITKAIFRRVPILVRESTGDEPEVSDWNATFCRMFDMANDSNMFQKQSDLQITESDQDGRIFLKDNSRHLALYEAKMVHHFDHRWGTYEGQTDAQSNQGKLPELDVHGHCDPTRTALPYYWVPSEAVTSRLGERWRRLWLLGFRGIARATDQRTISDCTTACASRGRSIASAARHCFVSSTNSVSAPQAARRACASARSALAALRRTSSGERPTYGGLPVRISHTIAPNPNTSHRRSSKFTSPLACSGGM